MYSKLFPACIIFWKNIILLLEIYTAIQKNHRNGTFAIESQKLPLKNRNGRNKFQYWAVD